MKKLLYGLFLLPSLLFADVKVSNLNEQLYPKTTDYMYIVANSTSMKVSLGSIDGLIKSVLISTVVYTNTAQSISGSKTFSSTQTFNNKVDIFSANVSEADKSVINDAAVLDVWKDLNDDPADSIAMFKFIYDDGLLSEYPSFQIDSGSSTAWTPLVVKQGITGEGLISNSLIDGSSITKQGLLTAGTNITLTPGAGTLTIAASGTGGGGANPLVVQYAGTNYDAAVSTINFSTSTFSLSSPIAGKVSVEISTNVTTETFNFFVPDDGSWDNESLPIFETPTGSTVVLTNFNATAFGVGNSTITFQLNERAFGKINESGSNIFSTDITVSSTGIRTTSFLDNTIAPESYVVMVTTSNSRKGLLNGLKGIISYKRIP